MYHLCDAEIDRVLDLPLSIVYLAGIPMGNSAVHAIFKEMLLPFSEEYQSWRLIWKGMSEWTLTKP